MSTERAARDSQHGRLKLLTAGVGFLDVEFLILVVADKAVMDFFINFVGGVESLRFFKGVGVVDIYACGAVTGSFFIFRVKWACMNGC